MTHSFDTDTPPESSRRQISLRERKFARTKHALLQAALERLRDKRLDEIPVKDLCEQVEVSEATFFNYFPKKEDLLRYYMQILTLDLVWHARNRAGDDAGLEYIEAVFERAAKEFGEHPRLMLEIIAFMAQQPDPANCPKNSDQPDLSLAERLQALPNRAGVENVPEVCFEDLVRPPIERAVHRGELGRDIDVNAAVLASLSTFFGVPLWLGTENPERIQAVYRRQLKLLWDGLSAAGKS